MPRKLSNEEFKIKLVQVNPNTIPLDTYVNSRTKMQFKCAKCGNIWETTPQVVLNGHLCPSCGIELTKKKKQKSNEHFLKELKSISPNVLPLEEYINAQTKIKCKCTKCGYEWKTKPNWLLSGHGCAKCAHKKRRRKNKIIQ